MAEYHFMAIKSLAKSAVFQLSFSKYGIVLLFDTRLKGFGVSVSKSMKNYLAEGRVKGNAPRVKLGIHGTDLMTENGRQ